MAVKALTGGEAVDTALREMGQRLSKAVTLKVGFLAGSTYPDAKHTSTPMVAAIHEFGAPSVGIPPRPFFRPMVKARSSTWAPILATLIRNGDDGATALSKLGMVIEEELRDSITAVTTPALSPVTLMVRKMLSQDSSLVVNFSVVQEARRRVKAGRSYAGVSTKPLIWSGHMQQSVDSEVEG